MGTHTPNTPNTYSARYARERDTIASLAAAVHAPLEDQQREFDQAEIDANRAEVEREQAAEAKAAAGKPRTGKPPASEKQVSFITSLLGELSGDYPAVCGPLQAQHEGEGFDIAQASSVIEALLALRDEQRKAQPAPAPRKGNGNHTPLPDVPAGRYAVTGDDGTTDFYKVDRPTEGKWAGYTFVKLLVAQGGHGLDALREQRLSFPATRTVLGRIETDGPAEASARFGKAIGHCGVCGRELTKDESIEAGIGPVCAGKRGW